MHWNRSKLGKDGGWAQSSLKEFECNTKQLCQTMEEKYENMCKEIRKVINETCKQSAKTAYADAVKYKGLPTPNL